MTINQRCAILANSTHHIGDLQCVAGHGESCRILRHRTILLRRSGSPSVDPISPDLSIIIARQVKVAQDLSVDYVYVI